MPPKPANLTPLGMLIDRKGFAIPFVIKNSGIDRKRLVYLRTKPNAGITLDEAEALAPLFDLTIEEFSAKLKEIAKEAPSAEGSPGT